MRITSGFLGGRVFRAPDGIRPTQDRVRQALFSSLGDRVGGARVLDLFAGSGALGLEAWSRGAESVVWVEKDPAVRRALARIVRELAGDSSALSIIGMDALTFIEKSESGPFDLVFADPPYRSDALEKVLRVLGARPILSGSGVLVFEQSASEPVVESEGWRRVRDKTYGETRLITYVKCDEANSPLSRDL